MTRDHMGSDGTYTINSDSSIHHRKKDGTTAHYLSTLQIKNLSDQMEVERIIREEKEKKRRSSSFGSI